jgi:hypothetical protein
MKVENFTEFIKNYNITESMMDDQWQDPDHVGDGGADEYSWADRDGNSGNYDDGKDNESNKSKSDYRDSEPAKNLDREQLTLLDLKAMLIDLSDRLKNFEVAK